MDQAVLPRPADRAGLRVPAGLLLLALVPAVAGAWRLGELAGTPVVTPANARFVADPLPVVLHIASALPFTLLGAFQFVPGLRRQGRGWHRTLGRLLAPLGLVAAVTGLWMTLSYPWAEGDGVVAYGLRLLFGAAMTASVLLGLSAVVRRDFAAHGAWMTRAYAIGMGAGTQVLTHLPLFLLVGRPEGLGRAVAMGAGWIINVAVAEWAIRRPRTT